MLMPLADRELKKIARKYMSNERRNHLLNSTGLINEAWVKLLKEKEEVDWKNRKHFYSLLALRMRQVLYDYARKRTRGERVPITGDVLPGPKFEEIMMVHEMLDDLAKVNKRAAEIVELRYFGGYTREEVADILEVGTATVERDSRFARSWLWREMTGKVTG